MVSGFSIMHGYSHTVLRVCLHHSTDLGVVSNVVCLTHLEEHGVVDHWKIGVVESGGHDGKMRTILDHQLATTGVHSCPGDIA